MLKESFTLLMGLKLDDTATEEDIIVAIERLGDALTTVESLRENMRLESYKQNQKIRIIYAVWMGSYQRIRIGKAGYDRVLNYFQESPIKARRKLIPAGQEDTGVDDLDGRVLLDLSECRFAQHDIPLPIQNRFSEMFELFCHLCLVRSSLCNVTAMNFYGDYDSNITPREWLSEYLYKHKRPFLFLALGKFLEESNGYHPRKKSGSKGFIPGDELNLGILIETSQKTTHNTGMVYKKYTEALSPTFLTDDRRAGGGGNQFRQRTNCHSFYYQNWRSRQEIVTAKLIKLVTSSDDDMTYDDIAQALVLVDEEWSILPDDRKHFTESELEGETTFAANVQRLERFVEQGCLLLDVDRVGSDLDQDDKKAII